MNTKPRCCIITLGVNSRQPDGHPEIRRDFIHGLRRLKDSLDAVGYDGGFMQWSDEYPDGSPDHSQSPFAFKPFCFLEAEKQGYEIVLWMDASVRATQSLDDLFSAIEKDGYLIFQENHSVGEYCKDEALDTLELTREKSFLMPSCRASVIGLDLRNEKSRQFLRQWADLALDGITFPGPRWSNTRGFPATASADPRVKGHRHDQTAASVVAWRLGMRDWKTKLFYERYLKNRRYLIPTLPDAQEPNTEAKQPVAFAANAKQSKPCRILFFSRGRGRGHAIPDLAIVDELGAFLDNYTIQFVSYSTGADTLRKAGWPVVDMRLPEGGIFFESLSMAHEIINEFGADVVVTHEEFSVIAAAKTAGKPVILVTDWFPRPDQLKGETITFADSIVFIGQPGIFPLPVPARCPILYTGPVVPKMDYSIADRDKARAEIGIPADAFVVTVIPGAWATEERAPLAHIVMPAFQRLALAPKRLFWLTKVDHKNMSQQYKDISEASILEDCGNMSRMIVASDVVITKGNRGTIMDVASLGVPSISLSYRQNPIDETLVAGIRSNLALSAKATDFHILQRYIEQFSTIPQKLRAIPLGLHKRGGEYAAKILANEIRRLLM